LKGEQTQKKSLSNHYIQDNWTETDSDN